MDPGSGQGGAAASTALPAIMYSGLSEVVM